MYRIFLLPFSLALMALGAEAATFNTFTGYQRSVCDASALISPVPTSASCDITSIHSTIFGVQPIRFLAQATAIEGKLGVAANLTVGDGSYTGRTTTTGNAQASFQDTIFVGIESGSLLFEYDIAGSQSTSATTSTGTTAGHNFSGVSSKLFASVNGITVYSNIISQSVHGTTITASGSKRSSISFNFNGGKLSLGAVFSTVLQCGSFGGANICNASTGFIDSIRFVGAEVRDENGDLITTSVSSSSGFDYLTGLEPHPSPVPLPATLPMLGFALVGMVGLARRRQKSVVNT